MNTSSKFKLLNSNKQVTVYVTKMNKGKCLQLNNITVFALGKRHKKFLPMLPSGGVLYQAKSGK